MKLKAITLPIMITLGFSGQAFAGESYGTPPGAEAPQAPVANYQFEETDLKKFAAAQGDLELIREEYGAKLENTEDPQKAQQLQQEASETMTAAVQATGLDVETYSSIAKAVRNDDALRQRVIQMMN